MRRGLGTYVAVAYERLMVALEEALNENHGAAPVAWRIVTGRVEIIGELCV